MRKIYIFLALLSLSPTVSAREADYKGEVRYTSRAERVGDMLEIEIVIDPRGVRLGSQQMTVLTPVLRSADGGQVRVFAPVVIAGRTRSRALHRAMTFGTAEFDTEPYTVVVGKSSSSRRVTVPVTVRWEEWMGGASLVLTEEVSGCVNCGHTEREYALLTPLLPVPSAPDYRFGYVAPPVEPVKERSESFVCHIDFPVDRWDLQRNFRGNALTLDRVDRVIMDIRSDRNLRVTGCSVVGYASPEGGYMRNLMLAENRARSFSDYLRRRHGWDIGAIGHEGRGEDWQGLRAAVEASPLSGRQTVLDIIDFYDVELRKAMMRTLPSYHSVLLPQYYAPLRRIEFRLFYVARAFDVEQAKELIRTKPQLLSLDEMFMVAATYTKGSEEFKHVFDVAARLFPNDATAILNAAVMEVETGALDAAIGRLGRLSTPEAWNLLGVAWAMKGDRANAEANLGRAAAAGSADAIHNLEQLKRQAGNR
jgi:hypothetical protein